MRGLISQMLLPVIVLQAWLYVAPTDGKNVVCYYANWAQYRPSPGTFMVSNVNPYSCSHLIFAFAKLSGDDVIAYEYNDDQNAKMWEQLTQLKKKNPRLKVLLALGGYSHSTTLFSQLASSAARRAEFAKRVIIRLRYWEFDGLDLDWEYPGTDRADDKENVNLLVKELREAFDREAINNNNARLLLTAATPAGITRTQLGYDIGFLNGYLDFFNVMTYDYHGQWEHATGLASPLNAPEGDPLSVTSTINYYLQQGASKHKLMIGLGFYARTWTLSKPGDTAVGSVTVSGGIKGTYTREDGVLSYYEVCSLLNSGYIARLDPVGQVMYASMENQWVTYENVETIGKKVDWILENDFGGGMVFSLDHDDFTGQFCLNGTSPLLRVVSERLLNAPDSSSESAVSSTTSTTTSTVTSTTTTSTSTSTTTTPTTSSTTVTAVPIKGGKFVCPAQNGKFPDRESTDCSGFYICYMTHPIKTSCSNGQKFSPSRKKCVSSVRGQCPA